MSRKIGCRSEPPRSNPALTGDDARSAINRQPTTREAQSPRAEIPVQLLVRLPHAFALRLELGECAAIDATDARHIPLAQRIQHFAQRLGLSRCEIGAGDLPLQQRLRDAETIAVFFAMRWRWRRAGLRAWRNPGCGHPPFD